MSSDRLSSENLHASTVARDGRAIIITGPSGSGKSDLALRMFDRGFRLVSDDRTIIRKDGKRLMAAAPQAISGKLEIRGIGIVDVDAVNEAPVALVVELATTMDRMPDDGCERLILGIAVPLITVDAMTASAPAKLEIALDLFGIGG